MDEATGKNRTVPFELMVQGDKVPVYEETLEDNGRFNEQPVARPRHLTTWLASATAYRHACGPALSVHGSTPRISFSPHAVATGQQLCHLGKIAS